MRPSLLISENVLTSNTRESSLSLFQKQYLAGRYPDACGAIDVGLSLQWPGRHKARCTPDLAMHRIIFCANKTISLGDRGLLCDVATDCCLISRHWPHFVTTDTYLRHQQVRVVKRHKLVFASVRTCQYLDCHAQYS